MLGGLVLWGAQAGTNLVTNGAFDRAGGNGHVAGWRLPHAVWSFDETAGRYESRALVWTNADPKVYCSPSQNPVLQAGKRYRLSIEARTKNMKGGKATCCLEWYGADGHYKGGACPEGITGTTDWTELSVDTAAIPTGMVRFIVQPLCTRGAIGEVWFDNFRLEEIATSALDGLYSDRYRNGASSGPVTFKAVLNHAQEGDVGLFSFRAQGAETWSTPIAVAVTDDVCSVTQDVGQLAPGENDVHFVLRNRKGVTRADRRMAFDRLTSAEETGRAVWIDAHGRTIVEGKPFFPLGMYWARVNELELDIYAQGPFNCLMPYRAPSAAEMDACAERKLKVIYNVAGDVGFRTWTPTLLQEIGVTPSVAGFHSVFWFYLGAFVGITVASRFSDWLAVRSSVGRNVLASAGLFFSAPFLFWASRSGTLGVICLALGLFGVARGVYDANFIVTIHEAVDPRYRAAATGFFCSAAFIVGAFSPMALGWCKASYGLGTSMSAMSGCYILAGLALLASLGITRRVPAPNPARI